MTGGTTESRLDPEVGSIFDDKYSVICVATKVAWYITCVRCSRGGASGMSYGGCTWWVVGLVCGRGFCGYGFLMMCCWGIQIKTSGAGEWVWTRGNRWSPGKCRMDPDWIIWKNIWSEILIGCELGVLDGVFLGIFQLDPSWVIWKKFW